MKYYKVYENRFFSIYTDGTVLYKVPGLTKRDVIAELAGELAMYMDLRAITLGRAILLATATCILGIIIGATI